ncbi:hypothetical protein KXR50_22155 [Sinorhizobium meliloti]
MSQDLESPCRLRPQDFVFAEKSVEPGHALIEGEYRHLAGVVRREIGIRLHRQDGICLRPGRVAGGQIPAK